MESNELLASLAKMEASLNEVESARKQVELTVKASSELQKEVRDYVSEVKALCVNLQSWESDLRSREGALSSAYEEAITQIGTTCADVIHSFENGVGKTSAEFKANTEQAIGKINEQIDKLDKHIQDFDALKDEIKKATSEIQTVKESLSQISIDLKESQDKQDEVLRRIDLNVTELPNKIEAATTSIIELVNSSTQSLQKEINDVLQKASAIEGKADTILSSLSSISTLCQSIKADLKASTASLTNAIEKASQDTSKAININRWLIIIGIIALAALQILLK